MKKVIILLCISVFCYGCAKDDDNQGAQREQQQPILSWEDEPYDKHEEKDIAELDGLMVDESNAKEEINQGEFSDRLTDELAKIDGVKYVKVIVHDNEIAAAVTHTNDESVEEAMIQMLQEQLDEGYEVYVSEDKATYRVAQSIDNGLRSGYDEKWEHENMNYLKGNMTKVKTQPKEVL